MNDGPLTDAVAGDDGRGAGRARLEPLVALDLAQTGAAWLIAHLTDADWHRPTPCDEWSVRDIVNKMTASTLDVRRVRPPGAARSAVRPRPPTGADR